MKVKRSVFISISRMFLLSEISFDKTIYASHHAHSYNLHFSHYDRGNYDYVTDLNKMPCVKSRSEKKQKERNIYTNFMTKINLIKWILARMSSSALAKLASFSLTDFILMLWKKTDNQPITDSFQFVLFLWASQIECW